MSGSRGESNFVNLPGFAARLYDGMMQSQATRQQYREIAQDLAPRIETGRLLDIGTGPGYLLFEIHHLNRGIELYGLDISEAMVVQAGRNLEGIKVHLKQGNITATGYESGCFDLVTCTGSFYLWDHPIQGLDEIHRILKDGCSAYLYETHHNFDKAKIRQKLVENLKGENLLRKKLAPSFFIKQLGMTYAEDDLIEIIESTNFADSYTLDEISIVDLPVWLRVELKKCL